MRFGGKSQQLDQPPDHLILHDRGRVVELGDLGVHARSEQIGEHRQWRPGADHPAPEARMDVAGRVGQDVALEFFVHVRRRRRFARDARAGQPFAHVGGHGPPHGAFSHRTQVLEHLVHHAVAEQAELFPAACVGRVEANLRR